MSFNKYRAKGAYHWGWYETEDWYKYLIDRAVEFCKSGSVIDIGCGEGVLVQKLEEKGLNACGIDKDKDAVALAIDIDVRHGDIETDGFMDKWDYMTCINVIEHLDNPEVIRWFIKNCVTKGAIITTIDYQGGTLGEDHKFEWAYEQMMDFFGEFNPKGFRYKDTEWIGVEISK